MTTKDVNVNQLATAIMWWLSYTSAVGRNYVLSESSIKYPASEYLERLNIDEIVLEYSHPKLSRKRFDLFFSKNSKEKAVFEFKYIKNGSTRTQDEKQRIFNDLMRLYLFLDAEHKAYFLICGNQSDFIKDFQKIKSNQTNYIEPKFKNLLPDTIVPEGFYTKWFSFDADQPNKTIDLNDTLTEYKDIYDLFFKEYAGQHLSKTKENLQKPEKLMTSLVFLSGNVSQPTGLFQPSKIGVWEISKALHG